MTMRLQVVHIVPKLIVQSPIYLLLVSRGRYSQNLYWNSVEADTCLTSKVLGATSLSTNKLLSACVLRQLDNFIVIRTNEKPHFSCIALGCAEQLHRACKVYVEEHWRSEFSKTPRHRQSAIQTKTEAKDPPAANAAPRRLSFSGTERHAQILQLFLHKFASTDKACLFWSKSDSGLNMMSRWCAIKDELNANLNGSALY